MKYITEIVIEIPRKDVIKKFDSTENMKHWQRGLISAEHLSGKPGEAGAKMNLKYKMGKREMEMTETITKSNFPNEFHAHYDAKGVHNIQENFFEDTAEGYTKWISKSEFQFEGLMMKIMGLLMPGAFKKKSMQFAVDFKNFAEKGISILDTK